MLRVLPSRLKERKVIGTATYSSLRLQQRQSILYQSVAERSNDTAVQTLTNTAEYWYCLQQRSNLLLHCMLPCETGRKPSQLLNFNPNTAECEQPNHKEGRLLPGLGRIIPLLPQSAQKRLSPVLTNTSSRFFSACSDILEESLVIPSKVGRRDAAWISSVHFDTTALHSSYIPTACSQQMIDDIRHANKASDNL